MTQMTAAPDISALQVPMDQWSEPFWAATAIGELRLPACRNCDLQRWPPGPFCPRCHSQEVVWNLAGPGRVYSFTILRSTTPSGHEQVHVPALIEFPGSGDVKILAAIVETAVDHIGIGAQVALGWSSAANVMMPVFRAMEDRPETP